MNENAVKNDYTVGSGNVFADLGLPNPEERQLKAKIAGLIYDVIEERGWTQKHSAEVLGITQPDVSKLTRGILKDFSVERLLYFLSRLEHRVTITVQEEKKKKPRSEIVIAPQVSRRESSRSKALRLKALKKEVKAGLESGNSTPFDAEAIKKKARKRQPAGRKNA